MMMMCAETDMAMQFVERINAHDVDGMLALMTSDHRFIDALGNVLSGRDKLRAAWQGYFAMVPDYTISVDMTFAEGYEAILCGTAGGTYAPNGKLDAKNSWSTPVALRAKIAIDLIEEWRVYADNEPIREKMRAVEAATFSY